MTGPGGGYVMVDFNFREDTVFMISAITNVNLPFAKYQVDDDLVISTRFPISPA